MSFDENNNLITTLYNKPTDTHLYLHYKSAHPSSIMEKSPYGQFLRLRRICTKDSEFEINATKLIKYYNKRGYPTSKLIGHKTRAAKFSQKDLLKTIEKPENEKPVLVTTYNPGNPNIRKFIHQNWNIIENTEELNNIFPEKPLIGFRRLPNLRNMLTSNTIAYPPTQKQSIKELPPVCTRLGKCTYCPLIQKRDSFSSNYTKTVHKTINLPPKHRLTCEIYNIIYLIECTKCNKQYVGETSRQFRKRIYEHIASAKNSNKIITPVSKHFSTKNHSYKNMQFSVIQWLGNENNPNMTVKRKAVENSYIWNIPTVAPIGINQFI